ncbi:MAG: oligosaccharide flippase family protein, partial [Bacteroidales bacterium]|nr:oligosaccharide flippase family protein [Bacteroidales bacterium]
MAQNSSSRNKRIATNTFWLYIRSLIVMLVSLYTSRVILDALGVEDYGLYNVVGGVVGLFSFLRTSMTKSTQRFLNVEMVNPLGRLKDTFSVSLFVHVIIAVVALFLLETVGLWFLNNYIQIPSGREHAANMVYQSTVFSLILTIISVPYNASIIAHEKMGYFAIVSIVDCLLKLLICYLILVDGFDRLILYGWLMLGVSFVNFLMYVAYCLIMCSETSFRLLYDKALFRDMFSYTTWTVVGQAAIVGTNQGNNILVNIFHTVTANAAMGVANQVNSAVVSLTSNFQTAFNPQITKSYAAKDYAYLTSLVYTTSKISYLLLLIVSLPLMFNVEDILNIWLKEVPQDAGVFCIWVL